MLNPELQKNIDEEIEKAKDDVKAFLRDSYWRDTVDLIIKVNKLNDTQAEGIELETILYMLGLSDYTDLHEAIAKECSIQNERTSDQVYKDIKDFLLEKIYPTKTIKINSGNLDDKPLRNVVQDAFGKNMSGPRNINYDPRTLVQDSSNQTNSNTNRPEHIEEKEKIINSSNYDTLNLDLYREPVDETEKALKREIDL